MKKIVLLIMLVSAMAIANAQTGGFSYQDVLDGASIPTETGGASLNGTPRGVSVFVFSDRAAFEAAAPGATNNEDFETNNSGGAFQICPEPVNAASDDNCFTPGQIVDGLEVTSSGANGIVMLPPTFAPPPPSFVIGAVTFTDTTLIDFSADNVEAVGMDVFAGLAPGDVDITIRNSGGGVIDVVTVTGLGAIPDNAFIGIISPQPIAQIELDGVGGNGELFDNIVFGSAFPDSVPVPTLQPLGLFILVLALAVISLMLLARRKTAG